MSDHVLLKPEDCDCGKNPDFQCPVCDGGLAFCVVCRKGEAELDEPCIEHSENYICDSCVFPSVGTSGNQEEMDHDSL